MHRKKTSELAVLQTVFFSLAFCWPRSKLMLGKVHPAHNGSRVHTTGILKNESIQLQQPQPSRPMDWIFGCFLHSHTQDMSEKQITLQILQQGVDCTCISLYIHMYSIACNASAHIIWKRLQVKLEGCPIHVFTHLSP